jgi:hypothetical protein
VPNVPQSKLTCQGGIFKYEYNGTETITCSSITIVQPVRLAGGWWLVLICSERKVLLAGCWWLICSERKALLAGG